MHPDYHTRYLIIFRSERDGIQAQIIQLLKDLKNEFNLTYLFISHDLRTVQHFCDRVAVMYLGEIVELASAQELFNNPLHPYTKALLQSIPQINNSNKDFKGIEGEAQTNTQIIQGCKFAKRCPNILDKCKTHTPNEFEPKNKHFVKCFLTN